MPNIWVQLALALVYAGLVTAWAIWTADKLTRM
jgi:hypothetical protein